MSYKVAVKVRGEPNFSYNAQRFATADEAKSAGSDLMSRWFAVDTFEVQESSDPVNSQFINGRAERIEEPAPAPVMAPEAPEMESPEPEPVTEEEPAPMIEEETEPVLEEKPKRKRKATKPVAKKKKKQTFGDGSSMEGIQPTYKEIRQIIMGKE